MLYCSTELAARIERAERSLIADGAAAMATGRPAGVFVRDLAGGVAAFTVPGSPLNKIAGLGFGGPLDLDVLAAVEAVFAASGAPVVAEVSTLADPSIVQALTRRGYTLAGFEHVLGLALPAGVPAAGPAGIAIEVVAPRTREAWLDTVLTGFAHPDTQGVPAHDAHEEFDRALHEQVLRDFVRTPGLVAFLAHRNGAVAGAASMRIQHGVAQLCGATTLPAHRRNGVQSALFADRLARAVAAGCDVAVVTALPGSKSHENAQRRGFELLYARAVLVQGGQPAR
jgi:hypothetical protein